MLILKGHQDYPNKILHPLESLYFEIYHAAKLSLRELEDSKSHPNWYAQLPNGRWTLCLSTETTEQIYWSIYPIFNFHQLYVSIPGWQTTHSLRSFPRGILSLHSSRHEICVILGPIWGSRKMPRVKTVIKHKWDQASNPAWYWFSAYKTTVHVYRCQSPDVT